MFYSKEEINQLVAGVQEGKTQQQILDEMYPKSQYQCMSDCAVENMRSFSLIGAIYNYFTKKEQPKFQNACFECLECADCI